MRILFFILIATSNILYAQTKNKTDFIMIGKVNYPSDRRIYFAWYNNKEQRFLDSAKVENGKFIFKGTTNGYLNRFYIKSNPGNTYNNDSLDNVNVPIDNSIMNIELKIGEFSKYKLTGSPSADLLRKNELKYKSFYEKSDKYGKVINDSNTTREAKKRYEELDSMNWVNLKNEILQWCKKNPSNNLAPYYLCNWSKYIKIDELQFFYRSITVLQKESFYGCRLKEIIDRGLMQKNQIGSAFIDFTTIGFDNSTVSLKEIASSNFVLLDFWASWCVPCRASHPKLIALYKKYKNTNFKIIGIADDDENVEKWQNAIKKDSVFLWPQVLRGRVKNKLSNTFDLLEQYYVDELPTKVLINDKGKIIGRYTGDNILELDKKLKEIYKF